MHKFPFLFPVPKTDSQLVCSRFLTLLLPVNFDACLKTPYVRVFINRGFLHKYIQTLCCFISFIFAA